MGTQTQEKLKSMTVKQIREHYVQMVKENKITFAEFGRCFKTARKLACDYIGDDSNSESVAGDRGQVLCPSVEGAGDETSEQGAIGVSEQCEEEKTPTPQEIIRACVEVDKKNEKKSQCKKLLELLSDGEWHTTVEILKEVYGNDKAGLARVSARIYDLKQQGYEIEGQKASQTIHKYRLYGGQKQKEKEGVNINPL